MSTTGILHSFKWSAIEKLTQFVVQFVVSIVLARILGPEEYAVIGILNVFLLSYLPILVDAGLSQSLIKKTDCCEVDYNTVFWYNLFVSVLLYFVLFISSPLITSFFHNATLLWTSRVIF